MFQLLPMELTAGERLTGCVIPEEMFEVSFVGIVAGELAEEIPGLDGDVLNGREEAAG